ncbi:MAG: sulfotransferase [Candidatus Promineifilaceae bacterium]
MSLPNKAVASWPVPPFPAFMHHPAALWFLNKWQVGLRPLLITGHGRSGTTWVGNVFATGKRVLYCFEPGSPVVAEHGQNDVWFRYLPPGQSDPLFEEIFDTAFRGLPYNRRWRRAAWHRLVPGYRMVVKEVAAFMCLEWLAERYNPAVLTVIRHPCPTILSELAQGTDAQLSRQALLGQFSLWAGDVAGEIVPYRSVLEKAQSAVEILAVIWAIRLRIFTTAFARHPEWQVVQYEALCANPVAQFQQLFEALRLPWTGRVEQFVIQSSTSYKPGSYSGTRHSTRQPDKWLQEMEPQTISAVRRQIEPFDLPFYRSAADWPIDNE